MLWSKSFLKYWHVFALLHEELVLTALQVKIEVDYTTKAGDFSYFDTCSLSIVLPLGVNVQDIFKEHA